MHHEASSTCTRTRTSAYLLRLYLLRLYLLRLYLLRLYLLRLYFLRLHLLGAPCRRRTPRVDAAQLAQQHSQRLFLRAAPVRALVGARRGTLLPSPPLARALVHTCTCLGEGVTN